MAKNGKLIFALPKKGRLCDDFKKREVWQKSKFTIDQPHKRIDEATLKDDTGELPDIEVLVTRSSSALNFLALGEADVAVVGFDTYTECMAARENNGLKPTCTIAALLGGVSKCAMMICAPWDAAIHEAKDLEGKTIATSYPASLRKWLNEHHVRDVTILEDDGGIELYAKRGIADAIFDIVESGETAAANGLTPRMKAFDIYAAVVRRTEDMGPEKEAQVATFVRRVKSACEPG